MLISDITSFVTICTNIIYNIIISYLTLRKTNSKPIAVLPVSRIPRFAIVVVVIGKMAAALVELLPKIAGIDSTVSPVDWLFNC